MGPADSRAGGPKCAPRGRRGEPEYGGAAPQPPDHYGNRNDRGKGRRQRARRRPAGAPSLPKACTGRASRVYSAALKRIEAMKKDIHTDYHEITIVMTDGKNGRAACREGGCEYE